MGDGIADGASNCIHTHEHSCRNMCVCVCVYLTLASCLVCLFGPLRDVVVGRRVRRVRRVDGGAVPMSVLYTVHSFECVCV